MIEFIIPRRRRHGGRSRMARLGRFIFTLYSILAYVSREVESSSVLYVSPSPTCSSSQRSIAIYIEHLGQTTIGSIGGEMPRKGLCVKRKWLIGFFRQIEARFRSRVDLLILSSMIPSLQPLDHHFAKALDLVGETPAIGSTAQAVGALYADIANRYLTPPAAVNLLESPTFIPPHTSFHRSVQRRSSWS